MPIFEFICKKCGKPFEIIAKYNDKVECEHCGSKNVERQFSTFSAPSGSNDIPPCAKGGCSGFSGGACGSGMCGAR